MLHRREECACLRLGHDSRRFIQNEDLHLLPVYFPCDLGELFIAHRHFGNERIRVYIHPKRLNSSDSPFFHSGSVQFLQTVAEQFHQEAILCRLPIQKNVFCCCKTGDEEEFLMHHTDAGLNGIDGVPETDILAVQLHSPLVPSGFLDDRHSEEDVHEGGFSGSILADEANYLSTIEIEADILEDFIPIKILLDILDRQKRVAGNLSLPLV